MSTFTQWSESPVRRLAGIELIATRLHAARWLFYLMPLPCLLIPILHDSLRLMLPSGSRSHVYFALIVAFKLGLGLASFVFWFAPRGGNDPRYARTKMLFIYAAFSTAILLLTAVAIVFLYARFALQSIG